MSGHYYSKQPDVKSEKKEIKETINGRPFSFNVDRGVFSKGGLDFGSRLLIESFKAPETSGPLADVGCGWGPVGIALAGKYPGRHVYMVDVNDRAVSLARENAELNGATNVTVSANNLLDGFAHRFFSAVITNPPVRAGKNVVFTVYEQAYNVLKEGGELWVVIQKKQGAPSTGRKLEALGFRVAVETKAKGYFIFRAKKY